ncbi:MAG: YcgN family cysteine cluster protein [Aestuariivita sp.]|nr:YcgN family cysteine cluster protein [Aestuariivita sp.]MCY4347488.1 YcgN family cysteine cluster protein [Aestuariivita sp.]
MSKRTNTAVRFWEHKRLDELTQVEWEALCDGCGKCCLNKLEDEETTEIFLTRVACQLLDDATCRCSKYKERHYFVPECIVLTADSLDQHLDWLPSTCAYRLIHAGKPLFDWHPLISGSQETVHAAGVSMRYQTVSEANTPADQWFDYIIEDPQ